MNELLASTLRRIAPAILLIALGAAPASKSAPSAEKTPPPPSPPAPAVDKSTPKGALLDVYSAGVAGDKTKIASLVNAASPAEQKAADVVTELILAEARWTQALTTKFPDDPFTRAGGGVSLFPKDMAMVIAATETIAAADKATIALTPTAIPIPLIKTAAGWKLSAVDILDPTKTGASLDAAIAAASAKAQAYASTSAEVAVGTYPTAQAAQQAFQKKLGIVPPAAPAQAAHP